MAYTPPESDEIVKNFKISMNKAIDQIKAAQAALVLTQATVNKAIADGVATGLLNASMQTKLATLSTDLSTQVTYLKAQAAAID